MATKIDAIYGLSPLQEGILFHSLRSPETSYYTDQYVYELSGELDFRSFERAWQKAAERHSILRTAFDWRNFEKAQQVVSSDVELPIERYDWRDSNGRRPEERLRELIRKDWIQGFDLQHPPLVRLSLIQVANDLTYLVLTFHHILMDGWSRVLLLKEVNALYQMYYQGSELALPPVRPYSDYIAWLKEQDTKAAEHFWRKALAGFAAPTPLSAIAGASETLKADEYEQGKCELSLSTFITDTLRAFSRKHQVTINTILQAAWGILLSRYSRERDVLFGATIAGRPADLSGVESMVGLFINTLPVRLQIDPRMQVIYLLRKLQEEHASAHQYAYTSLVEIQHWSAVPPGVPLFDTILVFQNFPSGAFEQTYAAEVGENKLGQHSVRLLPDFRERVANHAPLVLVVSTDKALSLAAHYDRNQFGANAIERLLDHLSLLIRGIAVNPEANLGQLTMLSRAERQQILSEWNETATSYPSQHSLAELFNEQVVRTPNAEAVVFGEQRLTYQELNRKVNQLAHFLRSLGVGPEVKVGLLLERSVEMVLGVLAVIKAGGAYVPLELGAPLERISYVLEDAQVPILLTQESLTDSLPSHNGHTIFLDTNWELIAQQDAEDPRTKVLPENLVYVIYTSGSTGQPKGVAVPHRAVVRLVKETDYAELTAEHAFLQLAPLSFDASTFEIWSPLLNGGKLVVMPPHTPSLDEVGQALAEHQITTLWLTAGLFHLLVDEHLDYLQPVRQLLAGGDVLSPEHVRKALGGLPNCQLINGYGPTESTTFACCYRIERDTPLDRHVPIGRPIANTQAYVLDQELELVPVGVVGELYLGGDGLARGYEGRADWTAERFIPHPFSQDEGERLYRTGDLVRYLADGRIEFLGRIDGQVKVRGYRIELGEIEAALNQYAGIQQSVVLLREVGPNEKQLLAYLVAREQEAPTAQELRSYLQNKLPGYMVPSAFFILQQLPLTQNGKLDRKALLELERADEPHRYLAPRSPVEETLCQIWAQVLRIDHVGVNDNFFELGGDSIISIQVTSRAHQAGLQIAPWQVFEHQTIAELAQIVTTEPNAQAQQEVIYGPVALTPIQHWLLNRDLADLHRFTQSVLLQTNRPLDSRLLKKAVESLLIHHDALRLRVWRDTGHWRQHNAEIEEQEVFSHFDLSKHLPSMRSSALEQAIAALHDSLDLSVGTLLRFAYFEMGPNEPGRLYVVIHHLAVDGVSWRILLEDLHQAYMQLENGAPVKLPDKTTSFKHWATALAAYADSEAIQSERDYWLRQLDRDVQPLPLDDHEADNLVSSVSTITVELSVEQTHALLHSLPNLHQTRINDVLLTAVLDAVADWSRHDEVLIDIEGHGREGILPDVDLSRTVGWFTTIYPIRLQRIKDDDWGQRLHRVKQHLRSIPSHGIGYGLLRYLTPDAEWLKRFEQMPRAEISFNYLGQFDQMFSADSWFSPAPGPGSPPPSYSGERSYILEIAGEVIGQRLRVHWTYSRNLHQPETIERLAQSFLQSLQSIINDSPPSEMPAPDTVDLSLLDLTANELNEMLLEMNEGQ